MPDTEVLVVGAGPVGCWLAAELTAAGVAVTVLEARESRAAWSRGFVVHPRTLEILDSRGVAAPLLESGRRSPTWHFALGTTRLDFTVLPTSFPFILLQPQARTEELLEAHLESCGGRVRRGRRLVGLRQEADHVVARVRTAGDGPAGGAEETITARFVVGCDGAHSTVRHSAGIGFSGTPDTMVCPAALAELRDPPPPELYMQTRANGIFFVIPLPDGRFLVSTVDHEAMHDIDTPWTAEMVRASLHRITGGDYGLGEVERVSTIGNSAKQADRYRDGRVLLAGDAAHVHFPMGGQGMNLGLQDAHALAWRLTAAVRADRGAGPATAGTATADRIDALLDGYEAERRPVGERVLEDVHAQMALVAATGADGSALRLRFEALLGEHPQVNAQYARRLSGIGVRYGAADGEGPDARAGARVPDLLLAGAGPGDEPVRLYALLAGIGAGRFLRLTIRGGAASSDAAAAPVTTPPATPGPDPEPVPELATETHATTAVLGPDWALAEGWAAPGTVLIRPDGHVAAVHRL